MDALRYRRRQLYVVARSTPGDRIGAAGCRRPSHGALVPCGAAELGWQATGRRSLLACRRRQARASAAELRTRPWSQATANSTAPKVIAQVAASAPHLLAHP